MRQLFIDSRDRIPGGTSTNFQIQLREQLVVTRDHSFRLDNLRVPLVIPLIQAGYNDKLYFTLAGVVKTATLAQGNYSGSELATLVQAAMAGFGATITATYDYHTANMSIVCSDATFHVLTDAEATTAGKALASGPEGSMRVRIARHGPAVCGPVAAWASLVRKVPVARRFRIVRASGGRVRARAR
jgi:hypothetical protein